MLGIHREDLIYLSDDGLNLAGFLGEKYRTVFPDFYLADGATIDLDGINFIHIIHTPGHTPGSVCLRIGNYLFSGDLLFAGGVGRTDLPGGNEKMLFQSIKKIFRMKKNLVIFPGHGPETTIEDELKKNPFISFKDNIYEN